MPAIFILNYLKLVVSEWLRITIVVQFAKIHFILELKIKKVKNHKKKYTRERNFQVLQGRHFINRM